MSDIDIWVPSKSVIADARPILRFINENEAIKAASEMFGIQQTLEALSWDGWDCRKSYSYDIFLEAQIDYEEQTEMSMSDLLTDIDLYDRFILESFLPSLGKRMCDDFKYYGYSFDKWISPTQVVLSSLCGRTFPTSSRTASRRLQFDKRVGYHHGYGTLTQECLGAKGVI